MLSNDTLKQHKKNSLINLIAIAIGIGLVTLRNLIPGLPIEIGIFALSLVILVRAADVFTDIAVVVG